MEFLRICHELPPGHWHCPHGHVIDCPSPLTCPRLKPDDEVRTYAILCDRVVWLFRSERLAQSQLRVLQDGGAEGLRYRRGLSAVQVDKLLKALPDGVSVEDCR